MLATVVKPTIWKGQYKEKINTRIWIWIWNIYFMSMSTVSSKMLIKIDNITLTRIG